MNVLGSWKRFGDKLHDRTNHGEVQVRTQGREREEIHIEPLIQNAEEAHPVTRVGGLVVRIHDGPSAAREVVHIDARRECVHVPVESALCLVEALTPVKTRSARAKSSAPSALCLMDAAHCARSLGLGKELAEGSATRSDTAAAEREISTGSHELEASTASFAGAHERVIA